jgi:hypothetical protein
MSVVIHILWLKGVAAVEIFREVNEVHGHAALSFKTIET